MPGTHKRHAARTARGFSLLEVLVAAFLLMVVFFGLAQLYARARTQLNYEEDRRKATAAAQMRLDGIRRDYRFDTLWSLDGTDTTLVVDDRDFTIMHAVVVDSPEVNAATIGLTVSWVATIYDGEVDRTLESNTILGRGMPWEVTP